MTLRLGRGEYEAIDVKIRNSTREARRIFFGVLLEQDKSWLLELLAFFNGEMLPQQLFEPTAIHETADCLITQLFTENFYRQKTLPEHFDTPLNHYYQYLSGKEDQTIEIENEIKKEREIVQNISPLNPQKLRKKALEQFASSWEIMKSQPDAAFLCESLKLWSEKWNLTDEWFLDFALKMLCNFKFYFDNEFKVRNQSTLPQPLLILGYRSAAQEAIGETLNSYVWQFDDYILKDTDKFSVFKYKWKIFEMSSETWSPLHTSRSQFVSLVKEILVLNISKVNELMECYEDFLEDGFEKFIERERKALEDHCDRMYQLVIKSGSENGLKSYNYPHIGNFLWKPSEEERGDFIDNTIGEIEKKILQIKGVLRSLESFTKRDFEGKLGEYCNNIEKSVPKNWEKVPRKYSEDEHFKWLIEFQLSPDTKFTTMAKKYDVAPRTVTNAVRGLGKILGLTVREAKKTGRTKGSKNSDKSLRQLGIFG